MRKIIAYQGQAGAYSDLACREVKPDFETLPCPTFEDAFDAVHDGKAELAMIPIENSAAGRVADIHHLLPASGLHIVGEHFLPIRHHLLGIKGAKISDVRQVMSHVQALSQCIGNIHKNKFNPVVRSDTAGAAYEVAQAEDKSAAAIASSLAAELYGLEILVPDFQDQMDNTTRFVILSAQSLETASENNKFITSLVFKVRSVPAALYKALGGFATNGVNITKLESYIMDGSFQVAQFYADIEGHPHQRPVELALEELRFFSEEVKILGTYPASLYRWNLQ